MHLIVKGWRETGTITHEIQLENGNGEQRKSRMWSWLKQRTS